jgi:hypothetical protein
MPIDSDVAPEEAYDDRWIGWLTVLCIVIGACLAGIEYHAVSMLTSNLSGSPRFILGVCKWCLMAQTILAAALLGPLGLIRLYEILIEDPRDAIRKKFSHQSK